MRYFLLLAIFLIPGCKTENLEERMEKEAEQWEREELVREYLRDPIIIEAIEKEKD
jgi:hypothetical protein